MSSKTMIKKRRKALLSARKLRPPNRLIWLQLMMVVSGAFAGIICSQSLELSEESKLAAELSGQLELFNSNTTGLGDLEATDTLKKMDKRVSLQVPINRKLFAAGRFRLIPARGRGAAPGPISGYLAGFVAAPRSGYILGGGAKHLGNVVGEGKKIPPNESIINGEMFSNSRSKVDSDRRLFALLLTLARIRQSAAKEGAQRLRRNSFLVQRRTDELIDDSEEDDDHRQVAITSSGNFPLLGEFGSRISLLTMRKVQPDERDTFEAAEGRLINEDKTQDAGIDLSEGASDELENKIGPDFRSGEAGSPGELEGQPDERETDKSSPNYLPRIARASKNNYNMR